MTKKKKLERRLDRALLNNQDFLIQQLKKEWEEIQRGAKREILVRQAKATASVIAKSILTLAAFAGVLTVATVAPNTFSAFGRMSGQRGYFDQKRFRHATRYLKNKEFINIYEGEKGKRSIKITENGTKLALSHVFNELRIKRLPRWDGFWRVVLFDIPNTHKWSRDSLRRQLKVMGFYQMQKSVFVSAFPCEKELKFLAALLNVNDYLRIIITNNILQDRDLREFFKV